ncbi:uncharacterized protein DFL_009012 [Arthrobotrys flagrans]|uniref:F-box domain-containing protein n=1 Tax=Arthrobotrys flagrans TaxID=97331 RepID=A0A436ZQP6_ARTFL|nr:hypothetical protein DFL_009012 [Arthrobotrys flagrans]
MVLSSSILGFVRRNIKSRSNSLSSSPQQKKQGSNTGFPFLSLPREIRDEIYSYIVLFHHQQFRPNLTYNPSPRFDIPVFKGVAFAPVSRGGLAILQVNKQVHSEATQYFYNHNAFPIQIVIDGGVYNGGDDCTLLLTCTTPWEDLTYEFMESRDPDQEPSRAYQPSTYYNENPLDGEYIHAASKPILPLPCYRNLIRKFNVEIIDTGRFDLAEGQSPMIPEKLRQVLTPFTARIRDLLTDCGDKVHMNIDLISPMFSMHESEWETKFQLDEEYRWHYRQLVEIAWPLTRGHWSYTLKTPQIFENPFIQRIKEETLELCDETPESQRDEAEVAFLGLPALSSNRVFAMNKGRLVVTRQGLMGSGRQMCMYPTGEYHIPGRPRQSLEGDPRNEGSNGTSAKQKIRRLSKYLERL